MHQRSMKRERVCLHSYSYGNHGTDGSDFWWWSGSWWRSRCRRSFSKSSLSGIKWRCLSWALCKSLSISVPIRFTGATRRPHTDPTLPRDEAQLDSWGKTLQVPSTDTYSNFFDLRSLRQDHQAHGLGTWNGLDEHEIHGVDCRRARLGHGHIRDGKWKLTMTPRTWKYTISTKNAPPQRKRPCKITMKSLLGTC